MSTRSNTRSNTRDGLPARVLFFGALALSIVFLIMSIVTWSPLLGLCALGLGWGLTRFLSVVGVHPGRATPPERRTQEADQE